MYSRFFSRPGLKLLSSFIMDLFKTIGTHDGVFHCDEVLGCAMLKIISPNAKIVRSRDLNKLSQCDIVIDVGGVYDPDKLRFDHHQREFNHSMSTIHPGKQSTIKLSSAGLIYCHYGKDVLRTIVPDVNHNDLEKLFDRIYENFIQEVDAIDNGISICNGEVNFNITTNLSSRVKFLNKRWNEDDFKENEVFNSAMQMVLNEFKDRIYYYAKDWLPARDIVLKAIDNRYKVHSSGQIIELSQNCPWKGHFFEIEKELNVQPTIMFVIFYGGAETWRVQAVSLDENSFKLRTPLLEPWRGLSNTKLAEVSGIDDIVFVHGTGFIGGNKTRKGALEMAIRTLAES